MILRLSRRLLELGKNVSHRDTMIALPNDIVNGGHVAASDENLHDKADYLTSGKVMSERRGRAQGKGKKRGHTHIKQ